jgi:hypothetical protein
MIIRYLALCLVALLVLAQPPLPGNGATGGAGAFASQSETGMREGHRHTRSEAQSVIASLDGERMLLLLHDGTLVLQLTDEALIRLLRPPHPRDASAAGWGRFESTPPAAHLLQDNGIEFDAGTFCQLRAQDGAFQLTDRQGRRLVAAAFHDSGVMAGFEPAEAIAFAALVGQRSPCEGSADFARTGSGDARRGA